MKTLTDFAAGSDVQEHLRRLYKFFWKLAIVPSSHCFDFAGFVFAYTSDLVTKMVMYVVLPLNDRGKLHARNL